MKENNFTFQFNIENFTEEVAQKVAEKLNLNPIQDHSEREEYFTTQQAMDFLQIKSAVTLRDYVKKGFIPRPVQRGGRQLFYKKSDLVKFLEHGI